ncbi:uncharacterized protein LOC123293488 [Chrysoperla carnea]|uniref:uncharacterized protein LOC123293488 n=1 Tax=Chrysoperla carnea TaxID=189513 RepID=UPI001D065390|nr:uncharacterized protein LOC123293488 [Chrysoperla carnea]
MISFIFSIILIANVFADPNNAQTTPPANNGENSQRSLNSFIQPGSYESSSSGTIYGGGGFSSLVGGGSSSRYTSGGGSIVGGGGMVGGGSIVGGAISDGSSGSLSSINPQRIAITGSRTRIVGGSSDLSSGLESYVGGRIGGMINEQLGGFPGYVNGNVMVYPDYTESRSSYYPDGNFAFDYGQFSWPQPGNDNINNYPGNSPTYDNRDVTGFWKIINAYFGNGGSSYDNRAIYNLWKRINDYFGSGGSNYDNTGVSNLWRIIKSYLGTGSNYDNRAITTLWKIINGYRGSTSSYPNGIVPSNGLNMNPGYPSVGQPPITKKIVILVQGVPTLVSVGGSGSSGGSDYYVNPVYPSIGNPRPSFPSVPIPGFPYPYPIPRAPRPNLPLQPTPHGSNSPWIYPNFETPSLYPSYPKFPPSASKVPNLWEILRNIFKIGGTNTYPSVERISTSKIIIRKGPNYWVITNSSPSIVNQLRLWFKQNYGKSQISTPLSSWIANTNNVIPQVPNPWEITLGSDRNSGFGIPALSNWYKGTYGNRQVYPELSLWNTNSVKKPSDLSGLISGISGLISSNGGNFNNDLSSGIGGSSGFVGNSGYDGNSGFGSSFDVDGSSSFSGSSSYGSSSGYGDSSAYGRIFGSGGSSGFSDSTGFESSSGFGNGFGFGSGSGFDSSSYYPEFTYPDSNSFGQ